MLRIVPHTVPRVGRSDEHTQVITDVGTQNGVSAGLEAAGRRWRTRGGLNPGTRTLNSEH